MSRIEALRVVTRAVVGVAAAGTLAACAHAPAGPTFQAGTIDPGRVLPRTVELVVIVDASLSMGDTAGHQPKLITAREVATSLVETVPAGVVAGSVRSFGQGDCLPSPSTWALYRAEPFVAADAAQAIARITCTGGNSPLDKALTAADLSLVTARGPVAVFVVSDGSHMGERDLAAAARLQESRDGAVCYYPIQVGTSHASATFLGRLADLGGCGRSTAAADLADPAAMAALVNAALFAPDGDGDRVGDDADRCPDTPAGAAIDAAGCPLDSDGDGVTDDTDRCPGTPRKAPVDEDGCPLEGVEVVSDEWHVAGDVLFDLDRATVRSDAQPILDRIAAWLGRNPTVTLTIEGHTDASGNPRHNQELSEQRATATRDYLVSRGVAATRLSCVGKGKSEPLAGNDTAADRQRNRRVELIPGS